MPQSLNVHAEEINNITEHTAAAASVHKDKSSTSASTEELAHAGQHGASEVKRVEEKQEEKLHHGKETRILAESHKK